MKDDDADYSDNVLRLACVEDDEEFEHSTKIKLLLSLSIVECESEVKKDSHSEYEERNVGSD